MLGHYNVLLISKGCYGSSSSTWRAPTSACSHSLMFASLPNKLKNVIYFPSQQNKPQEVAAACLVTRLRGPPESASFCFFLTHEIPWTGRKLEGQCYEYVYAPHTLSPTLQEKMLLGKPKVDFGSFQSKNYKKLLLFLSPVSQSMATFVLPECVCLHLGDVGATTTCCSSRSGTASVVLLGEPGPRCSCPGCA